MRRHGHACGFGHATRLRYKQFGLNTHQKSRIAGARRRFGFCNLRGSAACPAELIVFFAPHSYTCQNIAELHLPGSPPLLNMVVEDLVRHGARPAGPGESMCAPI